MSAISYIMIAGTYSRVGERAISSAPMTTLTKGGLTVQGFKIGRDFTVPHLHRTATGPGHNLDGWMLSCEANQSFYPPTFSGADLAIIEEIVGLLDAQLGEN